MPLITALIAVWLLYGAFQIIQGLLKILVTLLLCTGATLLYLLSYMAEGIVFVIREIFSLLNKQSGRPRAGKAVTPPALYRG